MTVWLVCLAGGGPVWSGGAAPYERQDPDRHPGVRTESWGGYTEGMRRARAEGRPAAISFYGRGAGWERRMGTDGYAGSRALLEQCILIRVDVEGAAIVLHRGREQTEAELAREFGVGAVPTLAILDRNGDAVATIVGYTAPEELESVLRRCLER